jgi:hypothetical protein
MIKWGRERTYILNIVKDMRTTDKFENSWFDREEKVEKDKKHKLYTR